MPYLNPQTVVRGSYARSFAAITTVSGSTHQRGFTQTYSAPQGSGGITPGFTLDQGFPAYPVPPFIDPSFANKDNIPWFQGSEATRPPEFNNFNLSIQRQMGNSMVVEASYNGVIGSHLQSQLLGIDQVNPKYLTFGTVERYGCAQQQTRHWLANAAGIGEPYPGFIASRGSARCAKLCGRFRSTTASTL